MAHILLSKKLKIKRNESTVLIVSADFKKWAVPVMVKWYVDKWQKGLNRTIEIRVLCVSIIYDAYERAKK